MNVVKRFVPPRRLTRQRISRTWLLSSLALVLTLLAGCIPIQPAATPAAITLRFAVPEAQGRTLTPVVLEFADQVNTLSKGSLTIEPIWDPMAGTPGGNEQGLVQMVIAGDSELGIIPSRAWDNQHITSFHVLQAPFLITDDALAQAVATSDVATRLLSSLSGVGVVGLTLWPANLRHPFSVMPDKPLLAPEDFVGLVIRAGTSDVTVQLIKALGASRTSEDSGYQGAESGFSTGYTIMGKPTVTGNVTFYPRFDVLFANAAAFDRLTDEQRAVLRQAATAAQTKAIAELPKEVDAAAAWCADGGTIVLASDEQVAAFEQAAQPVYEQIAEDPFNAELIAAIRELKASTTPSAGAAACAPVATAPSPAPQAETQTWSADLPPNGTWQVELTAEDFVQMGTLNSVAAASAGVYTWTFQDGSTEFKIHGPTLNVFCVGVAKVVGDAVRLQWDGSNGCDAAAYDDVQWRLDPDGLHFQFVGSNLGLDAQLKATYEAKPWQKVVEAWSPGLPPNGVWQVTLTVDELVQLGMLRSTAAEWAGVSTITFQDGKQRGQWVGPQGQTGDCTATYEVVENFVRITRTPITADCPREVNDIQWRLDDDGLHLHLVATNGQFFEAKVSTEAKPWQQVK